MTSSRRKQFWIAGVISALAFLAVIGFAWRRATPPADDRVAAERANRTNNEAEADAEYVVVDGVRRPAGKDANGESSVLRPAGSQPAETVEEFNPGTIQPIQPDANPQVASVAVALREKKHFERVTPLIAPPPFSPESFAEDPQTYLNTVEPGRVFQTAQPGPGVPVLRALSKLRQEIKQGESVKLRVKAAPNAPVTFTSFDLGAFENQLTSITVQSDAEGFATAEFFGTSGTFNDVNILVGSPTATSQVRYVVHVLLPQGRAAAAP